MKNIAFIINPISGTQNKKRIPKHIDSLLDHSKWATDIVFTEYKGHATELAQQYAHLGFDAVVAVGGDGTVNEVASGLRDTPTALGILPIGSGNGFARHLDIPLRLPRAIEMLNCSEPITVDYGMLNDKPFFCTCGTGFDALISEHFATAGKRGLRTYIEQIVKDVFQYTPETYRLQGEGIDTTAEAFLITFANANQWGNAAYIAPQASIQDGKMDIAILSKFPIVAVPSLVMQLFTKTLDKGLFMNTLRTKEITLTRDTCSPFHCDGDPIDAGKTVHIRIIEDGLRVLVAKRF
ncbi:MAG: YegS/Rv2252/BmrU family lipid kinase [Paludibacter sp.]|nr:YegS/Rv2252/BmrU family lipid kinase [Bacteroidales bacterium]MCM1069677.1 YegS/Rv2252/BmrU family lipid kinase [Prevotella sp.]MCM1354323.1 YegS/Rv2252/BmrU family lipid kinase [Bacteroides sp.]MCM1443138.1 YegS/Rv2252/BmrU family lipid kinase [Muribaculum sp.]MCM1482373.1 YegS/Rv2252/BmrU family lipid kinase [Paludibacter sp.]